MKKFILNVLSTIFASVFLMVVMFFSFISIHSGRFPPTITQAKEYLNSMVKAKDNYTAMMQRSEKFIKSELNDELQPKAAPAAGDDGGVDLDEINANLKQIKIQLNRIEQQNAQLFQLLRKK